MMGKELKIKELIEQVYRLDISSVSRQSSYVQARSIYYRLCIDYTPLNYSQISKSINRNHATLIHAMKQFDVLVRFIPGFDKNFKFIKAAFLEGEMFPEKEKRMDLDELLVKYNDLLLSFDELKVNFDKLENQKMCDCG
jgi:hypothetical protein